MPRYLMELETAREPWATVLKNPQNRADAVRPVFEAAGGDLVEYYFTAGGNTAYIIAEFPDGEALSAVSAAIMAGGAVASMKSTGIFTADEAVEIQKKAASIAYRPPSS